MASFFIDYGATATNYTVRLTGLTSSGTLLAGAESTNVSNATDEYMDFLVSGQIGISTGATANSQIQVWIYANLNDVPTYPGPLDGSASSATFTTLGAKNAGLKLLTIIDVTATSSINYPFGPIGIAQLFGGFVPKNHGIFVTHNTAAVLSATTANHFIFRQPVNARSV